MLGRSSAFCGGRCGHTFRIHPVSVGRTPAARVVRTAVRKRLVIGIVMAGLLGAMPAEAQRLACGGHRIEWVGFTLGADFGRAQADQPPPTGSLPGTDRARLGGESGGGYDPTHSDGSAPTIPEPADLHREVWEALVFDAQENPRPDAPWGVPLGQRQTLVMHRDIVPTVRICIQSPETSDTGKRLAQFADASWWRQQILEQTGLNWNGEIRIAACTDEPAEGWIHVREGRPGEVSNALAHALSRREFHAHGGGRWLWSELVWNPDYLQDHTDEGFESILAHELGHALGFWHVLLGPNYIDISGGPEAAREEIRSAGRLAYRVGPNVRYPENDLSGPIPPELGDLSNLSILRLETNNLSGSVPSELGSLSRLSQLILNDNRLTGPLPSSFTNLRRLAILSISNNAGLCAPADDAFQEWLATVREFRGDTCAAEPVPALTGMGLVVAALLLSVLGAGVSRRRRCSH